jgi:aminoglycoside phosphotransferase (APT) family kinase protein
MSRRRKHTGWITAKAAMVKAMRTHLGEDTPVEVGWVKRIGQGLYRDVYAGTVTADLESDHLELEVAAMVPRRDAPPETHEGARREVELLRRLGDLDIRLRIPRWAESAEVEGKTVLVREYLRGAPVDAILGRQSNPPPWKVIGEITATVHAIPTESLVSVVPDFGTRRAHAEACLDEIEEVAGEPVAAEAIEWIREHLPPNDKARLLHGDLLGQNVLFDFDDPPGLIDWEYCRIGDPAYDLAIVTRGVKRPFKQGDGLARLLDAYNSTADLELRPVDVHLYELCLCLHWLAESLRGEGREPPHVERQHLEGLLRRASRAH